MSEQDRDRLTAAVEQQAKSFKECLSTMLSDSCVSVEPYEEVIRDRVQQMLVSLQQKNAVC